MTRSYGDIHTLDGADLDAPEGSFFGLLGPNGAGKTTFINILVGLVRKISDRASIFGYDVEGDCHKARNRIGFVPQGFNVDHFFPIHEVSEHKAGYHGIPYDEATERADEVLRHVDIYDRRDTRFDWPSDRMKRRFMLARALIIDPDLFILDEPTVGVDVQLHHELWKTIADLNDSRTTTLLTTHYIEKAGRLCDEVAILDSRSIAEVTSPEELMGRGTGDIVAQLRDPPIAVPDFAVDDDRVEAVELGGTRLVAMAQQSGLVAPDVMQVLDRQGHELVDLEISRMSLGEVFVEITRRGRGRAAAEVEQRALRVSRAST